MIGEIDGKVRAKRTDTEKGRHHSDKNAKFRRNNSIFPTEELLIQEFIIQESR